MKLVKVELNRKGCKGCIFDAGDWCLLNLIEKHTAKPIPITCSSETTFIYKVK